MNKHSFAFPKLALSSQLRKHALPSEESKSEPMPADFVPGPTHVICGRGKKSYDHNEHFRTLVAESLTEYAAAPSKPEKSRIVTIIFETIGSQAGFVRKDSKTKRWVVVSEMAAREKIGQAFRDSLTDQYQSSKDVRQKKRKQARELSKSYDDVVVSSPVPLTKKSRPSLPLPTLLTTSDALSSLLNFSRTIARGSLSSPPTFDSDPYNMISEETTHDPFGTNVDLRFHPVQEDNRGAPRFVPRKRCSFSEISITFDSEEFAPLPALSI